LTKEKNISLRDKRMKKQTSKSTVLCL